MARGEGTFMWLAGKLYVWSLNESGKFQATTAPDTREAEQ